MGKDCAITVGINKYSYLRSLNYAITDADAMYRFFNEEMGFDRLYHFSDLSLPIPQDYGPDQSSIPTGSTLRRFLRTRFDEPFLRDGDNLWFFFAGHGVRYEGRDYLMPIDADLEDIKNSAIPLQYISERLRRSGADNVILLIDACRSYEGRRNGLGVGREKQQGVITLFSCSPEESSYEIQELGQGAFTHALLNSLQIQGEGNCATVERLYQRLRYQVPKLTSQYKRIIQTPYGVIEPLSKNHLILLPKQATLGDVETLKKDALTAEVQGKRKVARQLWVRVLAVSPADPEAIEGIERLFGGLSQSKIAETLPIKRGTEDASPSEDNKPDSTVTPQVSSNYSFVQGVLTHSNLDSLSLENTQTEDIQKTPTAIKSTRKRQRNKGVSIGKGTVHELLRAPVAVLAAGITVGTLMLGIIYFQGETEPPDLETPTSNNAPSSTEEALAQAEEGIFRDNEPTVPSINDSDNTRTSLSDPCIATSMFDTRPNPRASLLSKDSHRASLVSFSRGYSPASPFNVRVSQSRLAQAAPSFPAPESVSFGTELIISQTSHTACINKLLGTAFESSFPGAKVVNRQSSDAVRDVLNGDADLAAINRPLTDEEKSQGLIIVPVRREKIAIVISKDNPFSESITGSQFAQIFRGEIRDWSEVGGEAGPIKFIDRPVDNNTRLSLEPYPVFLAAPFNSSGDALILDPDTTKSLSSSIGTNGIGYVLVSELENQTDLKPVQIHKTPPDDPRYPFSQPYGYVYAGEPSSTISAFLGYATGAEGQESMSELSGYPVGPYRRQRD